MSQADSTPENDGAKARTHDADADADADAATRHTAHARVYFRLFGSPEWQPSHEPGVRRLSSERPDQLLGYLAWSGQWVTREQLADLFWPDRAPGDARRNVRKLLYRLREKGLPPGFEDGGDAIRWVTHTDTARLLDACEHQRYDEVVALYGGPFLHGMDGNAGGGYADWLANQRLRFASLWRHAMLACMTTSSPARRHELAETLVAYDPLDEAAILELAEAQRALGRTGDATQTIAAYEQSLKADFGIEPSTAMRERVAGWRPAAASAATPAPGKALPPALDAFVGRRQELHDLADLLTQPGQRWITVLGTGGIGKSRLLRQAIETTVPSLGLESAWVPLAEVRDAAEVQSQIAAALGIALPSLEQSAEVMANAIGPRKLLLAIDNAEHLDGWVPSVEALLAACPGLKVAVTSRQRTHARGEQLLPLGGLPQPDADSRDLDAASSFDAVTLFEHRARQAGPGFKLSDHLAAVLDIVAAVEGMPLAIELAATWLRVMTPSQIASELMQSPDLLAEGLRGEGLSGVFERSWSLLSDAEQRAFLSLVPFSGSFAMTQALEVAGVPLRVIGSLVDKSMVQAIGEGEAANQGMRLQVHPLVHHFVRRKAQREPATLHAAQAAHASCYAAWVSAHDPRGWTAAQLASVAAEWANLEVALRCTVAHGPPTELRALVTGMAGYSRKTNRLRPAIALFDSMLLELEPDRSPALATLEHSALRAPLLAAQADLRLRQGNSALAEQLAREGAREARRATDMNSMHSCIASIGYAMTRVGRAASALKLLESALPHVRRRHDQIMTLRILTTMGMALGRVERLEEAASAFNEALTLIDPKSNASGYLSTLNNLATLSARRGDYAEVVRVLSSALTFAQQNETSKADLLFLKLHLGLAKLDIGDIEGCRAASDEVLDDPDAEALMVIEAWALIGRASVLTHDGNLSDARTALRRATRLAHATGDVEALLKCMVGFAGILVAEGDNERASHFLAYTAAHPDLPRIDRDKSARLLASLGLPEDSLARARVIADAGESGLLEQILGA